MAEDGTGGANRTFRHIENFDGSDSDEREAWRTALIRIALESGLETTVREEGGELVFHFSSALDRAVFNDVAENAGPRPTSRTYDLGNLTCARDRMAWTEALRMTLCQSGLACDLELMLDRVEATFGSAAAATMVDGLVDSGFVDRKLEALQHLCRPGGPTEGLG